MRLADSACCQVLVDPKPWRTVEISTEHNRHLLPWTALLVYDGLPGVLQQDPTHLSLDQSDMVSIWLKVEVSVADNDNLAGVTVFQDCNTQGGGSVGQTLHQISITTHTVQDEPEL